MGAECTYGNDGGSVLDNTTYTYARELLEEQDAPTIILPCYVNGNPYLFVCAYIGDEEFRAWMDELDVGDQAKLCAAFLRRASREVRHLMHAQHHQGDD